MSYCYIYLKMNDAFIKLNLPSIPAPHYMGGEVRYHLGESTTPQTTLSPLPTSSFSKNQGEKVFTTQQYVKTYSQVLRDRKKEPSKRNEGLLTTYYDVFSR